MSSATSRAMMLVTAASAAAAAVAALGAVLLPGPRVIEIEARRFAYHPSEIVVQSGEPVVLAIRSLDFIHGLRIPSLGVRTDLPPGTVTRIALPALAPGRHPFLCDNFCGGGHEDMSGVVVVVRDQAPEAPP